MELIICKDAEAVAVVAEKWVANLAEEGLQDLYVPAGGTPQPLYALWRKSEPDYLSQFNLIQIDDVLNGEKAGCFREFFETELSPWQDRLIRFDEGNHQAQAAILGLGLNGHVAFHEPGLSATFYSGCVTLHEQTRARLGLGPGTWGVSYGVGAFNQCRDVLMIVTGPSKSEILQRLFSGEEMPAQALMKHPHLTIVADEAASAKKRARFPWLFKIKILN